MRNSPSRPLQSRRSVRTLPANLSAPDKVSAFILPAMTDSANKGFLGELHRLYPDLDHELLQTLGTEFEQVEIAGGPLTQQLPYDWSTRAR